MNFFNMALDFIFPPICGICGEINKNYICTKCYKDIRRLEKCITNKYNNKYYSEHLYIFKYEGTIRKKIIEYKFEDKAYLYKTFSEIFIKNKTGKKIGKKYLEEMENRNSERIYNSGILSNGIRVLPGKKEEYFDSIVITDIHGNGKPVPLLYMKDGEKSIGGFSIKQISDENGNILQVPLSENTVYKNLEIIYEKEVLGEKIYFREKLSIGRVSSVAVVINVESADFLE